MKQNKFRLIHLMAFSFLNFIFVSCSNWNDFFESYNKNFAPIAPEQKKFVLSDETQNSLIREEFFDIDYSINSELTASFCAPVDCDKYLWKITDLGASEPLFDAKTFSFYCWGTKSISVYFPTDSENIFYKRFLENNERQVHFTLTLTVTLGEKTYEDSTTLRIFKSNTSQE